MKKTTIIFLINLITISIAFAQFGFDSNLIAYYPFNGNANDSSGYGNHGTIHGATLAEDRFGNPSAAYFFDGNGYIQIPDASILNPSEAITLSAWFKTKSFCGTGNNVIISKGYSSYVYPYFQYHLGVNGNTGSCTARFRTDVGIDEERVQIMTGPDFWTPDTWYHLVATYGNDSLKFYVDGQLIDFVATTGEIYSYGKDLYIGTFGHNTPNGTPGTIDDIRIYNCSIDQSMVNELYNEKDPLSSTPEKCTHSLSIYPNPVQNKIFIKNSSHHNIVYEIFNIVGEKMEQNNLLNSSVDISSYTPGVYIIKLSNTEKQHLKSFRIIKID